MTIVDLQTAIGTRPDGQWGPISRTALLAAFTNARAPAASDADVVEIAAELGCTPKQLRAVAAVESSGAGFDSCGRPKMLFERHKFHQLTNGKWSVAPFSNPTPGGYAEDSWAKLGAACGCDPDAAFGAVSWGKFQVMGLHWAKLGYASAFALARSTMEGEASHYELLARFVRTFGLAIALRKLSPDPAACRDFAALYNGQGYRANRYDEQLAQAMH